MMFWHKSFGTLMCLLLVPRLATRMFSKIPPNTDALNKLSKASHLGTYALLTTMCGTGVGMGYFNGFGLPFFVKELHIPGAPKDKVNKDLGGWMWKVHKYAGLAF